MEAAEALIAPSASAQRAAAADRAPPAPHLNQFPLGGEAREGVGGLSAPLRGALWGEGERGRHSRARIEARPLGRATAYPIGWAGWGRLRRGRRGLARRPASRPTWPRSAGLLGGSHCLDMAPGWPIPYQLRAGRLSSAHRHAQNGSELALESRGLILVIKYTRAHKIP